jgi:hypothetical protein
MNQLTMLANYRLKKLQSDRKTERQKDRKTERQKGRKAERQKGRNCNQHETRLFFQITFCRSIICKKGQTQGFSMFWYLGTLKSKLYPSAYPQIRLVSPLRTPSSNKLHTCGFFNFAYPSRTPCGLFTYL